MLFSGILETTTTTGTGDLTTSAVTGRPRFTDVFTANATEANADPFYYSILTADSPPQLLEWGIGYCSAAGTLKRAQVIGTYAGGTLTNYGAAASLPAGTKNVICAGDAASWASGVVDVLTKSSGGPVRAIGPQHTTVAAASMSLTKDRLYYQPIRLDCPRRVTGIQIQCGSTALNGGTRLSRAAVYACQRGGLPGRKIVESGDTALNASFGAVTLTLPATRLPAGNYWLGFASDYTAASAYTNHATTCFGNSVAGYTSSNAVCAGVYEALSAGWSSLPAQAAGEGSLTLVGASAGIVHQLLKLE